jgi:hypothetical protein
LVELLKRRRVMQHSTSSAAVPTTLAETKIYKIKIVCYSTIIVGTLGYLPALHTNNGSAMITQRRNRKYYIPTTKKKYAHQSWVGGRRPASALTSGNDDLPTGAKLTNGCKEKSQVLVRVLLYTSQELPNC